MIKIEHGEISGFETAIRGMRNPLNSWDKSDSLYDPLLLGENDSELMKKLIKAGPDHSKFLRMIVVTSDITAPLYWWKEFDTYKIGTVANSCSTMHTIHKRDLELSDFSIEQLYSDELEFFGELIGRLNDLRRLYTSKDGTKRDWYNMIQLLPESFNQKRTVMFNYAVARNMYHARKNHKLTEWQEFCDNLEVLPESWLVTMEV